VECLGKNVEKNKKGGQQKRGCLIKTFFVMYILSGLLLVLLAYIVSKVEQQEAVARWGVIGIYVISCLAGGFVMGKWKKQRKFLWGMAAGFCYVAVLILIAVVMAGGTFPSVAFMATALCICVFSGMLGGMLS
jgi:putative membrane protein (TIGR04086 family)